MFWAFAAGYPVVAIGASRMNRVALSYASLLRQHEVEWPTSDDDELRGASIVRAFDAYVSDEHRDLVDQVSLQVLGQQLVVYVLDCSTGKSRSYTVARQLIRFPNPLCLKQRLIVKVASQSLDSKSVWPLGISLTTSRFVRWGWTITQPLWTTSTDKCNDLSVDVPDKPLHLTKHRSIQSIPCETFLIPWAEPLDDELLELDAVEAKCFRDVVRSELV